MYTYLFEVDVLKKYRGITRLSTLVDMGEGGIKIWPKIVDVFNGLPLIAFYGPLRVLVSNTHCSE